MEIQGPKNLNIFHNFSVICHKNLCRWIILRYVKAFLGSSRHFGEHNDEMHVTLVHHRPEIVQRIRLGSLRFPAQHYPPEAVFKIFRWKIPVVVITESTFLRVESTLSRISSFWIQALGSLNKDDFFPLTNLLANWTTEKCGQKLISGFSLWLDCSIF